MLGRQVKASGDSGVPLLDLDDPDGLGPALLALRRRWLWALATFIAVCLMGAAALAMSPTSYVAGATLSFLPRPGVTDGRDLASLLVERYPAIVASDAAMAAAAQASGATPDEVSAGLSSAVPASTLNLTLNVKLATPEAAQAAATAIYGVVLQENAADPNLVAVTVSPPGGEGASGLSSALAGAATLLVAAVAAVVVALLVDAFAALRSTRNRGSGSEPSSG